MKPMIIVPPELLDAADRKALEDNGICVVVAKDPAKLRFMDPLPVASSRTQVEAAAIKLSRVLLNGSFTNGNAGGVVNRNDACRWFVEFLVKGSPLDTAGSIEEQEQSLYNSTRRDEIARIAREEARTERAAKKVGLPTPPKRGRPSNVELAARAEAAKQEAAK